MSYCRNDCTLRDIPRKDGAKPCGENCGHFVSMHGKSGKGGRVASAGIPEEYRTFTLRNNPVREGQPDAFKLLDRLGDSYKRMFERPETPRDTIKNVYLWSREPGTGKTASACALANHWQVTYYLGSLSRGQLPKEDAIYLLDTPELQAQFNMHNRPNATGEHAEQAYSRYIKMLNHAKEADLLVMDDIGTRDATKAFMGDLHTLINYRYTKRKPTIFTSNLPMSEMQDVFDSRIYDRVRDLTVEIQFKGASKRGARK
jgi:DNA replication protein DnaC